MSRFERGVDPPALPGRDVVRRSERLGRGVLSPVRADALFPVGAQEHADGKAGQPTPVGTPSAPTPGAK